MIRKIAGIFDEIPDTIGFVFLSGLFFTITVIIMTIEIVQTHEIVWQKSASGQLVADYVRTDIWKYSELFNKIGLFTLGITVISLIFTYKSLYGITLVYAMLLGFLAEFLINSFGENWYLNFLFWGSITIMILIMTICTLKLLGLIFTGGFIVFAIGLIIIFSPILLPILILFPGIKFSPSKVAWGAGALILGSCIGYRAGKGVNIFTGKKKK
mgnify:CR=1 FL=1